MVKKRKTFFRWFVILALLAATHVLWLPLPARFLMVRDNIRKADAIVVLSGDWKFDRENKVIELYKQGFAGKIIRILERDNLWFNWIKNLLNLDITQGEVYSGYFRSGGIPAEAIITGEEVATSTFDELTAARDIILKNRFKSIILVTSDYHMRRALFTARWVFRHQDVKIYNATAHSKKFNPHRWWLHEDDIKSVVLEYPIMVFYLWYHFALGK